MRDFTLSIYRKLLQTFQKNGYSFFTFEDYCLGKAKGKYLIIRHDVDLKADNSYRTAKIEHDLSIRASYYFRIVPQSNQPAIIRQIADLGHEIGYHYEDLSITKGDIEAGFNHFKKQLNYFREYYPVKTVCMHGSPTSKHDNRKLWTNFDYHDCGIIGEPYFDFLNRNDVLYFTDTARMWDGDKYNVRDKSMNGVLQQNVSIHSTNDFIQMVENGNNQLPIMLTTHPQRWTDQLPEWLWEMLAQNLKNQLKRILVKREG